MPPRSPVPGASAAPPPAGLDTCRGTAFDFKLMRWVAPLKKRIWALWVKSTKVEIDPPRLKQGLTSQEGVDLDGYLPRHKCQIQV